MFQWLVDRLSNYIPAYFLVFGLILAAIIYALYFFAKTVIRVWIFYNETKNTNESIKGFTKQIEEGFEKFKKEVRKDIKQLKDAVTEFETKLRVLTRPKNKQLATAHSPINLTSYGEKLIEESGVKNIINNQENSDKILSLILDDPKLTNAYDAQQKTIEIFKGLKDDSMFVTLKEYAFKQGESLEDILFAAAIYFRKRVLAKLDLKEEDIDKNAKIIK